MEKPMAHILTEDDINDISDLFQAFQRLQTLGINPKGVSSLEDAKCRLLQYIQEQYGAGKHRHTNAADLLKKVLEQDSRYRRQLSQLYVMTQEYTDRIPAGRRLELNKNIPCFEQKLQNNLVSVQKSDCAILVAGEVSAGKSSLLNLILGQELLPTSLLSCTSVLCELHHSERKHAVAYPWDEDKPSEELALDVEDAAERLSAYVHQKGDRGNARFPYKRVEIFWPFPLLQGGIFIVDSPGIGESREMNELVKHYLPSAFAFIYVINSSNAGGLQPDRLQDLLAALRRRDDELSVFNPHSAIFVCNKWDQVPAKEDIMVKQDSLEKLRKCWPGIEEKQIFCMSTLKAGKSLRESGYVTQDFAKLLEGIEALLPISLQCKLENHYRWLSQLLRRSAFHLRVYIANETRSDEERKELTEYLHNQLDKLDVDAKRVAQDLKLQLHKRAKAACDQLIAHLASASTRARLMHWEETECPDGDDWDLLNEILVAKVNKRIRREVNDWDSKNGIFMDIQSELLHRFQEEFELMEDQLSIIEGGMIGRGGRLCDTMTLRRTLKRDPSAPLLSTKQKIVLGVAAPVLIPLGLVAGMFVLPVAGIKAIRAKLEERKLLKDYRQHKQETLSVMTDEILETFLNQSSLNRLVQDQMQAVLQQVETMIQSIPAIVDADRIMIDKLQVEREASETSLAEQYLPLYDQCVELQGKLDYFYTVNVRTYDVEFADLDWDPSSPPLAAGTFGDVYKALLKREDQSRMVAIKVRRETVDQKNVTDILMEEENLRKFRHINIVKYYGTCARRDPKSGALQLVMIMELCESTLRSKIVGEGAKNPGKLGHNFAMMKHAIRTVCNYVKQICSALMYLHERALVHRDLKPQNILLNKDDMIKLADVGLTKPEQDISGTKCGTTGYAAPEVLEGLDYDKSADIYSLGMVIWELWYGRLVQDEICSLHKGDIEMAIRAGARPSLARIHEPPEDWKALLRQCWSHNVKHRPGPAECYGFFQVAGDA